MINVYKVTKFTCPRTIFQLSCHMLRNAESRENGHLLKTQFDNFCIRVVVPELLECLDKGLNRLFTWHPIGPISNLENWIWIPPLRIVTSGPCNAIILNGCGTLLRVSVTNEIRK